MYLTDRGCLLKNKSLLSAGQDILSYDPSTGQVLTTSESKVLNGNGELDLTFDEWHQAWRCLLELIKAFVPQEFLLWEVHYNYILNNANRAEMWSLFLVYDVEIRRRATQSPIDPSQFSLGIWNNLESRYHTKKVVALVQADLKQYTDRFSAPNSPNPSAHIPQNMTQSLSFHNQHHPLPDNPKIGCCIFCGDCSKSHPSKLCTAMCYADGSLCHLTRQEPTGQRVSKSGNTIASHGTVQLDVIRTPVAGVNTSVSFAAPLVTMPSSVMPPPSLLCVNTPLIPDEWERLLNDITPFNGFSDVPNSLRFGFDMGVHTPPSDTYTPPNHNSALFFPEHVMSHIHKELSCRCYSGPFSRSRLELRV
jgi:hypothetical protein